MWKKERLTPMHSLHTIDQLKAEILADFNKRFTEPICFGGKGGSVTLPTLKVKGDPDIEFAGYDEYVEITDWLDQKLDQVARASKEECKTELENDLKNFQLTYGSFDSNTGYMHGYKTNEYGDHPTDILLQRLKKLSTQWLGGTDENKMEES